MAVFGGRWESCFILPHIPLLILPCPVFALIFLRWTGLPKFGNPGISVKKALDWRPSLATLSLWWAQLSHHLWRKRSKVEQEVQLCRVSPSLHFGQLSPRWFLWDAKGGPAVDHLRSSVNWPGGIWLTGSWRCSLTSPGSPSDLQTRWK